MRRRTPAERDKRRLDKLEAKGLITPGERYAYELDAARAAKERQDREAEAESEHQQEEGLW